MNSFFKKKKHRRWTWESPDGKTRNEIDYFLTNKEELFKDVNVLNQFNTSSDHRLVRAKITISIEKERFKMINKKHPKKWVKPTNIQEFEKYINDTLKDTTTTDINILNKQIITTIQQAQTKYCPTNQKDVYKLFTRII
uniref:Uncharacterized protein LOC114348256 n=1 Tax=Diabrotica virgifera virgifera TaxID=50390 RepID=A0A6P7GZ09_DIAVI